jgi:hypothetical protein
VTELSRLPQARLYLKAARWGIEELIAHRLMGYAFRFYMIGILASLRAVQHALRNHDRYLSAEHRKILDEWWKQTGLSAPPELEFIRTSRDLILKEGSFAGYAITSESAIGEGENRTVTRTDYDLAYYRDGERRELLPELQAAVAWCEKELSSLESRLPNVEPTE